MHPRFPAMHPRFPLKLALAALIGAMGMACTHAPTPQRQDATAHGPNQATEAQRLARLGDEHARAGNLEGASAAWSRALALDPSNVDLTARVGAFELARGNREWGLTLLARAARQRPDQHHLRALAHALADDGQDARALEVATRLLGEHEPVLSDALLMVDLTLSLHRLAEAETWASRAVALDSASTQAHVAVVRAIAARRGSPADVEAAFDRAQALSPRDPSIPTRRAAFLIAIDNTEGALALLTETIARLPNEPLLQIKRVELLAHMGRCAQASVEFNRLRTRFPASAASPQAAVDRCQRPPLQREIDPSAISDLQSSRAPASRSGTRVQRL